MRLGYRKTVFTRIDTMVPALNSYFILYIYKNRHTIHFVG
ncbi:hypothetical protein B0I21_101501 [Sphingobacterium paludis]|uniref:Uncharacterized protein n=1 Tax=Sphingobacterium paludis TaxID=1476465 RepID=A0A4R7D9C2_9SPHI|nr:hypothetical protein B0I21_101501 [Sphingobacterium paludis]